jgi:hypothetical protein
MCLEHKTPKILLQFGNLINTYIVGVHGKPAKSILVQETRFLDLRSPHDLEKSCKFTHELFTTAQTPYLLLSTGKFKL